MKTILSTKLKLSAGLLAIAAFGSAHASVPIYYKELVGTDEKTVAGVHRCVVDDIDSVVEVPRCFFITANWYVTPKPGTFTPIERDFNKDTELSKDGKTIVGTRVCRVKDYSEKVTCSWDRTPRPSDLSADDLRHYLDYMAKTRK